MLCTDMPDQLKKNEHSLTEDRVAFHLPSVAIVQQLTSIMLLLRSCYAPA